MITAQEVQRVAFTAVPYTGPTGATLTIDDIVKLTASGDWDGALYRLGDSAAHDIARQFNDTHHPVRQQITARPRRATRPRR